MANPRLKINSVTGKVIMLDPFLTKNPKTPPEHKDLAALGKVDLVLVFHAHGDHVGDGPELAKLHQAPLYRRETGSSSSSVPASSTACIRERRLDWIAAPDPWP